MTTAYRDSSFFLGIALMALFAIGLTGCGASNESAEPVAKEGQPPEETAAPQSAASIDDDAIGKMLTIEGEVVKQCPAVGCWFIVKDESGEVFVDLNPSGMHLKQKREGEHARVTGRVTKTGGKYQLEAAHIEFDTTRESTPET